MEHIVNTDLMSSCHCCLQCPPDKDFTTPYIHFGKTEIYSNMLKECFDIQIHMAMDGDGQQGICKECARCLRDASDFKLQVQHSQTKLQALLVKDEPLVKFEPDMDFEEESEVSVVYDELVKTEPDDDHNMKYKDLLVTSPASRPEELGLESQTYTKIDTTQSHKLKKHTITSSDITYERKNCGRSFGNRSFKQTYVWCI